jgi:hypothetical protein
MVYSELMSGRPVRNMINSKPYLTAREIISIVNQCVLVCLFSGFFWKICGAGCYICPGSSIVIPLLKLYIMRRVSVVETLHIKVQFSCRYVLVSSKPEVVIKPWVPYLLGYNK